MNSREFRKANVRLAKDCATTLEAFTISINCNKAVKYPFYTKKILRKNLSGKTDLRGLTRRFPTVSYALVPACAKLAHFSLKEEIARL